MTKIKDYIRGDTRQLIIPCFYPDGVTILPLTGAKLYFTVNALNAPADDSGVAFQKIVTTFVAPSGLLASEYPTGVVAGQDTAVLGIAWPKILPADTQGLTPGEYFYDIQVIDSSGNIYSQKQDQFVINADITRAIT